MIVGVALRAEKKAATRTAIADAALALFLTKGFDRVTVAEVADAARVSVNTAFNYFPTKEDLFFDRQDEVVQRLAGAVRGRGPGSRRSRRCAGCSSTSSTAASRPSA